MQTYTLVADARYLMRKSFSLDMCIISFIVVSRLLSWTNPRSKVVSVTRTMKRMLISSYLRTVNKTHEHHADIISSPSDTPESKPLSLQSGLDRGTPLFWSIFNVKFWIYRIGSQSEKLNLRNELWPLGSTMNELHSDLSLLNLALMTKIYAMQANVS